MKISIICPVFNAESYLDRCIDSVLNQSLPDWELILVDDGSTDKTPVLCERYVRNDSRIKCIHTKNNGVGSARQMGYENSKGDYVIHLDPDDWLEDNSLELLYAATENGYYDMVISDFVYEYANKSIVVSQKPSEVSNCQSIIVDIINHKLHGSCCNKLVKRSACIAVGAHFVSGLNFCEDVIFNIMVLRKGINVNYLNMALYHYDQCSNSSSLTRTVDYQTFMQRKLYYETLKAIYPLDTATSKHMMGELKKMALINNLLTSDQIKHLYPECNIVKSKFFMDTFFYYIGSKGFLKFVRLYFNLRKKITG